MGTVRRRKDRRGEDPGYARGDQTREQIIRGALPVFTSRGYEGSSIRDLAEPSGSRHAAIQYYFGGKEGLFRACAEFLCESTLQSVEQAASSLDDISLDAEPDVLIEGMLGFVTRMLNAGEVGHHQQDWALFLAREQSSPASPVFEIICERLHRPLVDRFAKVVGAIIGRSPTEAETLLRTSSIIASMFGMRSQIPVTLHLLDWDSLNEDRQSLWERVFRTHLRSVLTGRLEPRRA